MYAHAQAPVRVGIAGGGTDLPAWTHERVGRCLSVAVKMYTHAVAISRPDGQVVAVYRQRDTANAATEIANGLIRESALMHGWEDGFEVHTLSELSSKGSGLGVSSSIAVSLAACFQRLAALRNQPQTKQMTDFRYQMLSGQPELIMGAEGDVFTWRDNPNYRQSIARDAWTVEIDCLRRPIGRQDHMAATWGGLRLYSFAGGDATVERTFTNWEAAWVCQHLALVQLPEGHDARTILAGVKSTHALEEANEAVDIAVEAIEQRNLALLGRSLTHGGLSKFKIPGAVPPHLLELLNKIRECPEVYGCKIAGAGGGGHIVVACLPGTDRIIEAKTQLPTIRIEPDLNGVRSSGWE